MAEEPILPVPSPGPAQPQAPVPLAPMAGGLLPVPGDISQRSSSQSSSLSQRVVTPGLRDAIGERRSADAEMGLATSAQTRAAETAAEGIRLEQEAKNVTARKN